MAGRRPNPTLDLCQRLHVERVSRQAWYKAHPAARGVRLTRRDLALWLIGMGVGASDSTILRIFKTGSYDPELLARIEEKLKLPGMLMPGASFGERLQLLASHWPKEDAWLAGESVYRAVKPLLSEMHVELRRLLEEAQNDSTNEQLLALLGLTCRFTGAIHTVWPNDRVQESLQALHGAARRLIATARPRMAHDEVVTARLHAAVGRLAHCDGIRPGVWAANTTSLADAKAAAMSLRESEFQYELAARTIEGEDEELWHQWMGQVWVQHVAQSRTWAKGGVPGRAWEELKRARSMPAEVRTPLCLATESILEARIIFHESGAASRRMLRQLDALYAARDSLVNLLGTDRHHLVACTDMFIGEAKKDSGGEEWQRGSTTMANSVVKKTWIVDLSELHSPRGPALSSR